MEENSRNMKSAIDIVFEFENDLNLLSYRTSDDIPVYLMAKSYVLRFLLIKKMTDINTDGSDRRINLSAVKYLFKSEIKNLQYRQLIKDRPILFYTTSRPSIIEGKYLNRYSDQLAALYPDLSGTIEQSAVSWLWPYPRYNDCVIYDALNRSESSIMFKLIPPNNRKTVEDLFDYIQKRAKLICNVDIDEIELNNAINDTLKKIYVTYRLTKWLENNISDNTRIVIMSGGAYPDYFPINRMLKSHNIITADLQHGYITKYNAVYNYSDKLKNCEDVRTGAPDYFLTYGKWWNSQINGPSKKRVIGNPYRDLQIQHIKSGEQKKRILLIGCGTGVRHYVDLAESLSKKMSDYEIAFRPHPNEMLNTYEFLRNHNRYIKVDENPDIYSSLEGTEAIVSEVSTVLFEAIGIVKKIIVYETKYSKNILPEHPFDKCKDADDICKIITSKEERDFSCSEFWDTEWKTNYSKFLGDVNIFL